MLHFMLEFSVIYFYYFLRFERGEVGFLFCPAINIIPNKRSEIFNSNQFLVGF